MKGGKVVGYRVPNMKVRLVRDGAARVFVRERIDRVEDAYELFRPVFRGLVHEEVHVAFLDRRNQVRGMARLSQGGLYGAALRPSDIFRAVILSGQGGFVIAHNHPSGDPTPSAADIMLTREIAQGAAILGLYMVDHVVIAGSEGQSHAEIMGENFGVERHE